MTATPTFPRLAELVARAQQRAGRQPPAVGLVHPCDALALQAAAALAQAGIARPVLVGSRDAILKAAQAAGLDVSAFELVHVAGGASDAACAATRLVHQGAIAALMKGSLHTDELMSAVVHKTDGLRGPARITHAFVFDLPRYHKLLALADCVVNIAPDLRTKVDVVGNAVHLLRQLGNPQPKVAVVCAVETINAAIPATLDAQGLIAHGAQGHFGNAIVEGPFGFDNAFNAEAARIKGLSSSVAGDADLMVMPDLNAGNMLYKSFVHVGGGDCAGLVLGAKVPIVLTSRADSQQARVASAALAVLAMAPDGALRPS